MKERFCCGQVSNKKIVPSVSAPLHLILRAPSPAPHEWKSVPTVKRLCQVCHLVVDGKGVRCRSCGLRAHSACGINYSDNTTNATSTDSNLRNRGTSDRNKDPTTTTTTTFHQQHQDRQGSLFYRHFEPRIKKILHSHHLPSIESGGSEERGSGASSSARFSSCGDSVAASTAIVVGGTVSIETTRSESKTPEIIVTPGSEVAAVGTEIESRLLAFDLLRDQNQSDSGCAGLLDEEEDEENETGSGRGGENNRPENRPSVSGKGRVTSPSVSSPGQRQVDPSGPGGRSQKKRLLYPEGPLEGKIIGPIDGSPYAVLVKGRPHYGHSGFTSGVENQNPMKDLDRLINALVQEAESIDAPSNNAHQVHRGQNSSTTTTTTNIPYHAREDSLPFSYTSPQSITSQSEKLHHIHTQACQGSHQGDTGVNQYSASSPSPLYATPTPISNHDHYSRSRNTSTSDYNYTTDQQIVSPQPQPVSNMTSTGLSRSISHQPSYSSYGRSQPAAIAIRGADVTRTSNSQMVGSLSSNSFNYGSGIGNGIRRNRSQSADGRRDHEIDHRGGRGGDSENADEWLAKLQQKLRDKKAVKHVVRNDWLAELKRALPSTQQIERSQSQMDYSQIQTQHQQQQASSTEKSTIREFRPSQMTSSSRMETRYVTATPPPSSSACQTPISLASSTPRGNINVAPVAYSSDDDDDVEIDIFQRGKKLQRHYSESTYDRTDRGGGYNTSSSSRAPSQQSQNYAETPFPTCPPTPYTNRPVSPPGKPPRSPKAIRRYHGSLSSPMGSIPMDMVPSSSRMDMVPSSSRMERAQTPVNPRPIYIVDSEVKFAQDLSEYWYKPYAAREETVLALIQSPIGSFVIRNSNSFPGAYGLAIKADNSGERGIRHFLIEPTRFGCRLRGCGTLEPVFGSLSALVYAHSIECLALPTTLTLPSYDILPSSQSQSTTAHLLKTGAACQLLFLGMVGVECLSGEEAIAKGVGEISAASPVPISLRLSRSGLTLTDVFRKQFFRIHFALSEILYASVVAGRSVAYGREVKQVFGIVARAPRALENSVILLAEFETGQPANAIVSFIQRVLAWQQH